ncbi:MAG: class II aldolase/adducin family protein [Sciscionella sp.]
MTEHERIDAGSTTRGRETELAGQIVTLCRRMVADGLVVGTSGNVSARLGEDILITPTGVRYETMSASDIVTVDTGGTQRRGTLRPTSELPLHLAIYAARADVASIVHTHAAHATAVSTLRDTLPAIHYVMAGSGPDIRVAPYATYGSDALARNAVTALRDRGSALLRNHGTLSVGADPEQAYDRALALEWSARVWLIARSAGEPTLIDGAEMRAVAEKLRGYGQPKEQR